jgi:hypothetical protein
MSFEEAILAIGGMFGGLGIAVLAIAGHFRHERRKRELEHLERMRAFELGRTLPQDEPWLSPTRLAAMIGMGVPLGAFASAGIATIVGGFHEGMWIATALVGTASAIAGSVVATQAQSRRKTSDPLESSKPYVEEDAYDVVSSRG